MLAARVFLHDPDCPASDQPVFWHEEYLTAPILLSHRPDWPEHWTMPLSPAQWPGKVALHVTPTALHAIVTAGEVQFRIGLHEPPRFDQPVGFMLPADDPRRRSRHYAAFHSLINGVPLRQPPASVGRKRQYLIASLRAVDAWHDNASYRTIATALFGEEAIAREYWKTSSSRQQVIRLVKSAQGLIGGRYADLLDIIGFYVASAALSADDCPTLVG